MSWEMATKVSARLVPKLESARSFAPLSNPDLAGYTGSAEILPLGKKANKEAAERMRSGMIDMIQDVADEENEDGEDAEQREWEEAQIRRGEGRKVVTSEKSSKRPYKPTPIPRTGTLPSLSLVSTRLSTSLNALTSSLSLDSSTLTHFEREKAELEAQEQELRKEVEGKERRREWFEGFREEMEIVGGFLEEKVSSSGLPPPLSLGSSRALR